MRKRLLLGSAYFCTISAKRVSEETDFALTYKFQNDKETPKDKITPNVVKISNYVACIYDNSAWIGVVIDKCTENKDIKVKFLHPKFHSPSYHWPPRDDMCWITEENVLTIIETPKISGSTGRQYLLTESDSKKINMYK